MQKVCTVQDAREVPGGLDSWDLDKNGFAFMKGLPPIHQRLENPADRGYADMEGSATFDDYCTNLAEAARVKAGAESAYVTNYILREEVSQNYNVHCHSDFGTWSEATPSYFS